MNKMVRASRNVLSQYATFSGRASRPELWWWFLAVLITLMITSLIDAALIDPLLGLERTADEAARPLSVLVSIALIVPNLAVGARRLHDTGRTGWWLLIGLVPIVGPLALIYFYVQPSASGDNEWGARRPLGD
ncbi:MAG: DUF805 domain-containing protein [Pseudomonadota bacterium]